MKRFQFNLDGVLHYRQQVLDGIQGEYAQALDQVHRQEARKEAAEERYRQLNREFREAEAVGITAADALRYEGGLRFLEQEIARETQRLDACRQEAEAVRERMMQAHIDKAVLERLREKKHREYEQAAQKSQERFIDELVSARRQGAAS